MSVLIAPQYTQRWTRWTEFKAKLNSKGGLLQYEEAAGPTRYVIWFYDGPDIHLCEIMCGVVPDSIASSDVDPYTQSQNDADKSDFETKYKTSSNRRNIPKTNDGAPLMAEAMRTGSELILPTHNFCDPTTWYTTSVRVTDGELSDSGDGLTWESGDVWIDLTHGRLFDEDALRADVAHGYSVEVKVDGVAKTQRTPFASSGGDYTVNYETGEVTFATSQTGKTVTATYSCMVDSHFVIAADPGTRIDVEKVKAQFSADIVINDTIIFEIWAYNPYNLPNKFKVEDTYYKTLENFIEESFENDAVIPAVGGDSRGIKQPLHTFKFAYRTMRSIKSSQGIELRIRLENDQPFGGARGSATFFCTVKAE